MPNIYHSSYRRKPFWMFNQHIETIYPSVFRQVKLPKAKTTRLETSDGDFLDIDFYAGTSDKCVVISHGLEGNSRRPYVTGMAKTFLQAGWNVVAWNFRGCSGEINRKPKMYHSGATEDLHEVVKAYASSFGHMVLVGFSLGGNLTLKYMGEPFASEIPNITAAVAFSVPLHLSSSGIKISSPSNRIYAKRFLRTLKQKIREKSIQFPSCFDTTPLDKLDTIKAFDDVYTGPIHQFKDAEDYYQQCSSLYFLEKIEKPTLIVNAKNDPFLSEQCFPHEMTAQLKHVFLEVPDFGGHVGFYDSTTKSAYWSEQRALSFVDNVISLNNYV